MSVMFPLLLEFAMCCVNSENSTEQPKSILKQVVSYHVKSFDALKTPFVMIAGKQFVVNSLSRAFSTEQIPYKLEDDLRIIVQIDGPKWTVQESSFKGRVLLRAGCDRDGVEWYTKGDLISPEFYLALSVISELVNVLALSSGPSDVKGEWKPVEAKGIWNQENAGWVALESSRKDKLVRVYLARDDFELKGFEFTPHGTSRSISVRLGDYEWIDGLFFPKVWDYYVNDGKIFWTVRVERVYFVKHFPERWFRVETDRRDLSDLYPSSMEEALASMTASGELPLVAKELIKDKSEKEKEEIQEAWLKALEHMRQIRKGMEEKRLR